ncbi:MAG TPA: cell wall-binding repeat-containing protein, partial [Thermomicrobiales bacterium]|nr:cell wall-binding repeat-containing protein [Thermomicrobiales bacterium]
MPSLLIGRSVRPVFVGLMSGLLIAGASIAPAFRSAAPVAASTYIREAGSNRYSTAARVSRLHFAAGVSVVYVVNGDRPAEGLVAAAAAVKHGPVLLVKRDHVPSVTRNELERLRPDRIVIVGPAGQVSTAVRRSLRAIAPVVRRTGHSRYGTAVDVSQARFNAGAKMAYIANPNKAAWALGAAPAAHGRGPILFSRAGSLPASTATELRRLNPDRIIIAGGTDVISAAVADRLATIATVRRESGPTQYSTVAKTSRRHFTSRVSTVWVVSGTALPYAMGAGTATKGQGPVLLVKHDSIPPSTRREILRLTPTKIIVIGGTDQVSSAVARALGDHAPIAAADTMSVAEDCSRLFWVLRNDSDPDGDHLSMTSITNQPGHGTASIVRNGRAISYRPDASYTGPDTLTYRVGDGRSGTDTATVSVTVAMAGDHDGDGISDGCDAFALDPANGSGAAASFTLDFDGPVSDATLLQDLGFDGVMYNANGPYTSLYDAANVDVSGGRLTINAVP